MTDLHRFPGAPADAILSEEGWLLLQDEAWDETAWSRLTPLQRRAITGDVEAWDDTEADRKRRRKRLRDRETRRERRAA